MVFEKYRNSNITQVFHCSIWLPLSIRNSEEIHSLYSHGSKDGPDGQVMDGTAPTGSKVVRNKCRTILVTFCYYPILKKNPLKCTLEAKDGPEQLWLDPAPTWSKVVRNRCKMILITLCYHLL